MNTFKCHLVLALFLATSITVSGVPAYAGTKDSSVSATCKSAERRLEESIAVICRSVPESGTSSKKYGIMSNGMAISRPQSEVDCMEAFQEIALLPAKLTVPSLYKAASNLNTSSYSRIWLARCLVKVGDWRGFDLAKQALMAPTPELVSSAIELAFECQGRMEMVYDVETGRRNIDLGTHTKDELDKAVPKMSELLSSKVSAIRWYANIGFEKSHTTKAASPLRPFAAN